MISGITIESLYFETTKDINGKKNKIESFNSFYLMISSGARGSEAQIKQICGMRGLMSYKNHGLMEIPVINSLREGLSALEYFYFSHGSRKTLADTALKTSNAGYLTRRLVEVANDIFISEEDCNTNVGLIFKSLINKGVVIESFLERIVGRVLSEDIINYNNNSILYKKNTLITKNDIKFIENLGINIIKIRSPITCQSSRGVCSLCYGFDLSKNKLVNIGELVGIIAAQSIGEPGTQLTMRTFHSGGGVNKNIVFSSLESNNNGIIEYSSSLKYVINNGIKIVVSKIGKIKIKNFMNEELETVNIPYASSLLVNNNCLINIGDIICK